MGPEREFGGNMIQRWTVRVRSLCNISESACALRQIPYTGDSRSKRRGGGGKCHSRCRVHASVCVTSHSNAAHLDLGKVQMVFFHVGPGIHLHSRLWRMPSTENANVDSAPRRAGGIALRFL